MAVVEPSDDFKRVVTSTLAQIQDQSLMLAVRISPFLTSSRRLSSGPISTGTQPGDLSVHGPIGCTRTSNSLWPTRHHAQVRDVKIVGMRLGKHKNLLLLVQVLHNPRVRSDKLRGRDAEFHQLSEGGREAINELGR